MIFEGTLDQNVFIAYIKNLLQYYLHPDDFLILDGCSVHKSKIVLKTFEDCGINVIFLPPYSPDLNPIELFWSKIKSFLRNAKSRTFDSLCKSINLAFNSVNISNFSSWFSHCGYFI